jgi:hypothetical protein
MWKISVSRTVSALALGAALAVAGCGKKESGDGHGHDHGEAAESHGHQPKNGGQLVEIGKHQFNLEVLLDATKGRLTVWVLDAHAEGYVRIPAKSLELALKAGGTESVLSLAAVANAASGETVGDTSQFEATADSLKGLAAFAGTVKGLNIRGQSFGDVAIQYPEKHESKH